MCVVVLDGLVLLTLGGKDAETRHADFVRSAVDRITSCFAKGDTHVWLLPLVVCA